MRHAFFRAIESRKGSGDDYTFRMVTAVLMWLGPALELLIVVGLVARRRVWRLWSLAALMLALLVPGIGVAVWPELRTWSFWTAKETLHAALFLVVGFEIMVRVFGRLPGAAHTARVWSSFVILVTLAVIVLPPYGHPALTVVPRLSAGASWIFLGILLSRLVFLVPLDPLHKAVLLSIGPYTTLYAASWGRVGTREGAAFVGLTNALAFVLVLGVLVVAAWRPERPPNATTATVRFLWPWS
jgi:hypothetical protein